MNDLSEIQRLADAFAALAGNLAEMVRVAPRDNDFCAFAAQEFRGGQANTRGAAGYEDNLFHFNSLMLGESFRVGIGVDGSGPGARVHLGGPRQCLRVDILPNVRQFAISNGNGEDPMVLERPIRGFDSPRSDADDLNPVSLRYEFGGLWV